MKNSLLLIFLLLSFRPASAQKPAGMPTAGFTNLDSMAQEFVRCLKASPEQLRAFCYRITYDSATLALLKKLKRPPSIIKDLERLHLDVSAIAENYNRLMQDKREDLRRRGEIASFEYTGRKDTTELQTLPGSNVRFYWTETAFLFRSKLQAISCKFGELVKINGCWKTDTEPQWIFYHGPAGR